MTIYKSSAFLIPPRRTFLTLIKAPTLGFMVVGLILGLFSGVANPAQLALAQGINGLITHTTITDFNAACTVLPGTAPTPLLTQVSLSDANGGEIRLTATVEDYFEGSTINSTRWLTGTTYDWYIVPPSVSGGILTLDSAYLRSQVGFNAATPVRFFETHALQRINSNNASWPDLGFYREFPPLAYGSGPYPNDSSLRIFVTRDINTTFVRGRDGDASNPLTDIDIPTLDLTQYHNFRIEWDASESRFYVDGVLQGTIPGVSTLNTWVFLYSQDPASFSRSPMQVDWVRAGVYPSNGTYTSCIQDAGEVVNWTSLTRAAALPTDTSLAFDTRTSVNGVDWSPWAAVSGNTITSPSGRYFQYRAALATANVIQSPELQQVEIRYYGPSNLTVSPNPITLDPGQTQQFVAQAYDDNGQPVNNLTYSWQVVNGGGTIDSTGLFTAGLSSGTYADTVQATSGSLTGLATVVVRKLPPIADAGGPYTGDETQSIALNGSNSADPNGGSLDYAWDLDEDGQFDDAAVVQPGYTWSLPGVYTATLQVTDSQGLTGTDTAQVTINNLPPSADAGGPYSGNEEAAISLNGSGSDPGIGAVSYAWDLDGDGQFDDALAATTSYTWNVTGTFSITLQVTDAQGATATDTAQVTVLAAPAPPSTTIFLPLIFNGGSVSAGQPDLTPQALLIEPGSGLETTTPVELRVVIKNTGTAVAAANFWVDMYINPLPFPNEAGHLWGMLCPTPPDPPANPCADDYGLAWQVTTPLAPGQVITLTSSSSDPYLVASPHTVWPGSFNKSGLTSLWVYVDSWNGVNVPAGFIAESNETNNRLGPVNVNVSGAGVTNPSDTGLSENQFPPARPLPQ